MKKPSRLAAHLVQLGILVAVLGAWYWATLPGGINHLLLPPPIPVFEGFWVLFTADSIWPDLLVTVREWVTAVLLASVSGCTLGYLISRSGYAVRVFDPLLAGLYSIPAILLFPLYLLFFGLGPGSKIAIGTTIAFFPIVLNTIAGLAYVDKAYITAARSMGASDFQLFWSVMLPAAFPVVLTGLRIGCIVAFLSILGGETISSLAGLGHRIVSLAENMETSRMFSNILFAVLIAIVINVIVTFAEARGRRGMQ
ncbi:MAG TPA: ABC transporter permease [Stellaceae bacterium]|jgi:ABC-type nitrate/sulfonate/bicarbonate transport system permease component|nr:ABC transporter permease [Stellaceae bacterium]